MKHRRIGTAIVLVGNLLFGWGLYNLMGIGSCGGAHPACPDSSWPYFLAMPVGIIMSIAGIFAGGLTGFVSLFATVGIASIWRGIDGGVGGDGDTTFPFVFGGLFLAPALLPFVVVPLFRRRTARKEARQGSRATGTVTAVRDTGMTFNNSPGLQLSLRIQPADGAAPAAATPETEWVTELAKLNDLRLSGALTDEEFTRAKDRLLSGSPREPAA